MIPLPRIPLPRIPTLSPLSTRKPQWICLIPAPKLPPVQEVTHALLPMVLMGQLVLLLPWARMVLYAVVCALLEDHPVIQDVQFVEQASINPATK
jgi:hypothetical protein